MIYKLDNLRSLNEVPLIKREESEGKKERDREERLAIVYRERGMEEGRKGKEAFIWRSQENPLAHN